jgi:hypothetical protein
MYKNLKCTNFMPILSDHKNFGPRIKSLLEHNSLITLRDTLDKRRSSTRTRKLLTQNSPHANPAIARTTISQKEESLESQASQIEKLSGRRT